MLLSPRFLGKPSCRQPAMEAGRGKGAAASTPSSGPALGPDKAPLRPLSPEFEVLGSLNYGLCRQSQQEQHQALRPCFTLAPCFTSVSQPLVFKPYSLSREYQNPSVHQWGN